MPLTHLRAVPHSVKDARTYCMACTDHLLVAVFQLKLPPVPSLLRSPPLELRLAPLPPLPLSLVELLPPARGHQDGIRSSASGYKTPTRVASGMKPPSTGRHSGAKEDISSPYLVSIRIVTRWPFRTHDHLRSHMRMRSTIGGGDGGITTRGDIPPAPTIVMRIGLALRHGLAERNLSGDSAYTPS